MPVPRSVIVSRGMRGICQNGNFSKRDFTGYTDCVSDTPCPGGSLFFSTDCAGSTNCVSVFVPNGRGVFCLYQAGELRSAERGRLPRPRLGQRGRDTCGFPSSLNSYLSLEDSTAKIGEAGPLRKGERQSAYPYTLTRVSSASDSACHTVIAGVIFGRHIAVPPSA